MNTTKKSSHLFTYMQEGTVIHVVCAEGYRCERAANGRATVVVEYIYKGQLRSNREVYSSIPANFDAPLYRIDDNEYIKVVFPWHPDWWEVKSLLSERSV
jgi:hypothetical protein